jgi:hypothetical protein
MDSSPSSSSAIAVPQKPGRTVVACAWTLVSLLVGCSGGGGGSGSESEAPVGSIVLNPVTQTYFIVAAHQGGDASSFRLHDVYWGRLVDVYDQTSQVPVLRDFVIGDDIVSNGFDFELTLDPLTERESLRILHPIGTPEFASALALSELNLQVFQKKGIDPSELPPFTAVPRNATTAQFGTDPACLKVKQFFRIDLSDRCAVRALHIVGVNL